MSKIESKKQKELLLRYSHSLLIICFKGEGQAVDEHRVLALAATSTAFASTSRARAALRSALALCA